MAKPVFTNPFRPGAGHMPPYLAGRHKEKEEFLRLLDQRIVLENLVLTGLRGVGKTVLQDTLKPLAIRQGWLWVGTDLSESTSINEDRIAIRLMTDLAPLTSSIVLTQEVPAMGISKTVKKVQRPLDFNTMEGIFNGTPGLISDKLKAVLEFVWGCVSKKKIKGVIFAYDEAQNLSDHAEAHEYPLSLMLDVFQSLQKKNIPLMLVLVGLPTLFPKLVEARTFAERMFHVVFLKRLNETDSRDAILKPIQDAKCPVKLNAESVRLIVEVSGGYPYFLQFICREVYDAFLQQLDAGQKRSVPIQDITRKLDNNFFAGRWAKATDRQRELLIVIASMENCDEEFTVQEIVECSKKQLTRPFSPSHVNQMLSALSSAGLVYKNRHGKYSFAVPLLGRFIQRQQESAER